MQPVASRKHVLIWRKPEEFSQKRAVIKDLQTVQNSQVGISKQENARVLTGADIWGVYQHLRKLRASLRSDVDHPGVKSRPKI